jgi:hypothetical protein
MFKTGAKIFKIFLGMINKKDDYNNRHGSGNIKAIANIYEKLNIGYTIAKSLNGSWSKKIFYLEWSF